MENKYQRELYSLFIWQGVKFFEELVLFGFRSWKFLLWLSQHLLWEVYQSDLIIRDTGATENIPQTSANGSLLKTMFTITQFHSSAKKEKTVWEIFLLGFYSSGLPDTWFQKCVFTFGVYAMWFLKKGMYLSDYFCRGPYWSIFIYFWRKNLLQTKCCWFFFFHVLGSQISFSPRKFSYIYKMSVF